MDAPGFPEGPESPTVQLLLWGLLIVIVIVSVGVTVLSARRGPHRGLVIGIGVALLVIAIVTYFFMLLPSYVFESPTDSGGVCPIDAIDLAFMRGDKNSEFYAYWQSCRDASRRTIALALGGFAVVSGVGGLIQLRLSKRNP